MAAGQSRVVQFAVPIACRDTAMGSGPLACATHAVVRREERLWDSPRGARKWKGLSKWLVIHGIQLSRSLGY